MEGGKKKLKNEKDEETLSPRRVKVDYDYIVDHLAIRLKEKLDSPYDHSEEMGPIIVSLSEDGRPIGIEILDASELFSKVIIEMRKRKGKKGVLWNDIRKKKGPSKNYSVVKVDMKKVMIANLKKPERKHRIDKV
jgi:uncharacterized protein YuzE